MKLIYTRFDRHDFKVMNDEPTLLCCDEEVQFIKHIKCGKACGPGQISVRVLRPTCKAITDITSRIIVPIIWMMSEIVPIPNIKFPKIKND